MKKKFLIILIIVIVVIGGFFLYEYITWASYKNDYNVGKIIGAKSKASDEMAVYQSDEFGFQFSYPAQLSIRISKDKKTVVIPSAILTYNEWLRSEFEDVSFPFEATATNFYITVTPSSDRIDQYVESFIEETATKSDVEVIDIGSNSFYQFKKTSLSFPTDPIYHHMISNGEVIVDILTLEIDKDMYDNTLKSFKFI